jgi:hypothetical protein
MDESGVSAVSAGVAALVSGLVITFVMRRAGTAKARAGERPGEQIMGYPAWLTILVAVVGVITVAAAIGALLAHTRSDRVDLLGIAALFGALGLPLAVELRFRAVLSPDGMRVRRPWRGAVSVDWSNVASVEFATFAKWFVIRAHDGRTIYISMLATGIGALVQFFRAHLDPQRWSPAVAVYDDQRGRM